MIINGDKTEKGVLNTKKIIANGIQNGHKETNEDENDQKTAEGKTNSKISDKDINGNFVNDKKLYNDENKTLHGYNKMTDGCGEKIQLEDPTKKEYLVRICGFGGGGGK